MQDGRARAVYGGGGAGSSRVAKQNGNGSRAGSGGAEDPYLDLFGSKFRNFHNLCTRSFSAIKKCNS